MAGSVREIPDKLCYNSSHETASHFRLQCRRGLLERTERPHTQDSLTSYLSMPAVCADLPRGVDAF